MKKSILIWLKAFRLRTLPLALATTTLGSAFAFYEGKMVWFIAIFSTLTALLLQVLSNLSNDLGDYTHGTDNVHRIGPKRTMQAGLITRPKMKRAIIINILLALISGLLLIVESFTFNLSFKVIIFFTIGVLSIVSAIKYTVGSKPYGYAGLGDLFVFIWFGLVGVTGTYYLHAQSLNLSSILLGISLGLLSTGVLNINNLRDIENDTNSGKNTLIVKYGIKAGKYYQVILVILSFLVTEFFLFINFNLVTQLILILPFSLLIMLTIQVTRIKESILFDSYLKKYSLGTLIYSICLQIGLVIAAYA